VKGHHGVVEDDSDAVVQEGLAEDEEVETHVDADLLENSQDGNLARKHFNIMLWLFCVQNFYIDIDSNQRSCYLEIFENW